MTSQRAGNQPLKIAIMQPYLFPYIGYFQLINAVDKFVLLDTVNFINRGWINRNRIVVNGKEHMISIPLQKASQNRIIKDLRLAADTAWQVKFMNTLRHSYHRAPNFSEAYPLIEAVISRKETHITDLIRHSITVINDYLGIRTEIIPTSSDYHNYELKGAHKILDICTKEGADEYINPIGGMELYDRGQFSRQAIKLNFLRTKAIRYRQTADPFIPNLSIIDVLMNNSRTETIDLLTQFELV